MVYSAKTTTQTKRTTHRDSIFDYVRRRGRVKGPAKRRLLKTGELTDLTFTLYRMGVPPFGAASLTPAFRRAVCCLATSEIVC